MNTKVCVECKRNAKKDDITNENKGVNKERNMFKICNNYDNHNHSASIVITLLDRVKLETDYRPSRPQFAYVFCATAINIWETIN